MKDGILINDPGFKFTIIEEDEDFDPSMPEK